MMFDAEDFKSFFRTDRDNDYEDVAYFCNKKLNKLMESWSLVYGKRPGRTSSVDMAEEPQVFKFPKGKYIITGNINFSEVNIFSTDRHCTEEENELLSKEDLIKSQCKHEPNDDFFSSEFTKCKNCGVDIQHIWTAK